ncbi:MAG TPA: acyl-CoA dehydrogenase family protein [Nitriliruptorales bacterium]|nr:acyl-CoA dehydrogenase family protein [Nitriliruptorales bacterium]
MSLSFALTPEQEEFRAVVADFADQVIAPAADGFNRDARLPLDILRRMGEMGLFGIPFPDRYGGMGGDFLTLCLAVEEIGRVDQSLGITLEAAVGLGAESIHRYGTEEQKQRWLPPLARGEALAGFALTEPAGGSDLAHATATRAELDGDSWVLNGRKAFTTNAGTPITSLCTVTARTGQDEISSFVVPVGADGFSVAPPYRKVGWHASDTREVVLDDCRVPPDHLLGERGRGLAQSLSVLDDGRIAISALAVGLIQGCIDECVRYARERYAYGAPIARRQGVAFKIADMEVAAQTARGMYWHAAWRKQEGLPYRRHASVAKLYASEQAVEAARQACQVFGGYGFMTEYRVARFYQDAKALEIGEGTSEVQRHLIARDLGLT